MTGSDTICQNGCAFVAVTVITILRVQHDCLLMLNECVFVAVNDPTILKVQAPIVHRPCRLHPFSKGPAKQHLGGRNIAAGLVDGLFCHLDCLTLDVWQHVVDLMQQVLQSQQSRTAGLQLAAIVGIGRLLMHAPEVCDDLGQTELLVVGLVHTYVQPEVPEESESPLPSCW